jgi:nucleotide-binding universal stress UspA family protein
MARRKRLRKPVPKFAKILLAVDLGRESGPILDYGITLARAFGSQLDLVHVFERHEYRGPRVIALDAGGHASLAEIAGWTAAESFAALVEKVRHEGVAEARGLLAQGPAEQILLDLVLQERYDLVVMGTHGYRGLERLVMGSVAESVVRDCACPVLTVHIAAEDSGRGA